MTDVNGDPGPRFRHDDDTIARGRAHIAAIRERLGSSASTPPETPAPNATPEPPPADPSVERMIAEMAAGAERHHLETRVAELEHEVRDLRRALAAILHTAAGAVAPGPNLSEDSTSDAL